jgi:hypothetical protein
MLPMLQSRKSQLCQEFLYFPTAPPHVEGGIFELRSYQLNPGTMLEWEHAWLAVKTFHRPVPVLMILRH